MSLSRGSAHDRDRPSPTGTDLQLQGCLRRFLSIYLDAQKREAPTSLACVKNCLLAMTILFTAGGENHLPATDPVVARYLDELLDCLTDRMVRFSLSLRSLSSLHMHRHRHRHLYMQQEQG